MPAVWVWIRRVFRLPRPLSGQMLYSGWENVCVDIWGPRTGKTTSRAIPGILAAPARCWSPQISVTWWMLPVVCVSRSAMCGSLTRRLWLLTRQPGGGTRSPCDR